MKPRLFFILGALSTLLSFLALSGWLWYFYTADYPNATHIHHSTQSPGYLHLGRILILWSAHTQTTFTSTDSLRAVREWYGGRRSPRQLTLGPLQVLFGHNRASQFAPNAYLVDSFVSVTLPP